MFLVMGITGKVGGATAEHLLARGKEVRELVRNREKTSSWANQGVELVDGDWNDSTAIERALKGVVELGSMVTADEVAEQLGEVLNLDVKAFAVPRAGWAKAFEQFGIPKGHTGPAEEMFEAVNAGWMDLGVEGTEHVAGTTSARDVLAAAQRAVTA
jgi:NAD(P)-dependent dehydrogenase (short-subunit alcohol dehydrogenase family)